MKNKLRSRNKNKLKVSGRLVMVIGALSVALTLVVSWMVYLNISNLEKTRASGNGGTGGNHLNSNSEIISEFTWEKDPVTHSTLGPEGISVGKTAHSVPGGRSSTQGMSAGTSGKNIDLTIPSSTLFNQDGIDISIDFRRNELSGDFFTRGSGFNFGMNKGFITINYRIDDKKGGYETVSATTEYEIPTDNLFRNYRFIYSPSTGKGEIFVNSIIVWSSPASPNTAMYWKDGDNITIGKNMDGGGKDIAILDNLVIRSTGSLIPLAESLVNFMVETTGNGVRLHWSTMANDHLDNFSLQRSINGIDFATVATVKVNPKMTDEEEYTYIDNPSSMSGVFYYRLRQNFKNGKFIVHPLSAIKFDSEKELSIERVNPVPFEKTFDVSYFTPASGRVWIQLTDAQGKVRSSETFEAPQGKNVHVFKNKGILESGTYTLNLIFGDKRVSTTVIKS